VEGRALATEQEFTAEKIIQEEPQSGEPSDYTHYLDPQYSEQLMAESLSDEDLPSVSLPKKGPATEAPADQATTAVEQ